MTVLDNLKVIMWAVIWGRRKDTWEPQTLSLNGDWTLNIALYDSEWKPIWSLNWALNIHDADVHNVPVNEYFHRHTWVTTTVNAPVIKWDYIITIADTNINNWDNIQIEDWVVETTFPTVISWWWTTTLTLDRPLDNAFAVDDPVEVVTTEMNVLWTIANPVSFKIEADQNQIWHIVRFLLWMTHSSTADDSKFWSIPALENWVILRWYNAETQTYRIFTNWKTNKDIKLDMYDVAYTDKAGWGLYWTNSRGSIKLWTGATPRIDWAVWDFVEILIQDDLTWLESFNLKAQWHIEGL